MRGTALLAGVVGVLGLAGCMADVGSTGEAARQACGGITGATCPSGFSCVDDLRDDCDPTLGGADCAGICKRTSRQGCGGPDRHYVSRDPNECAAIMFLCADGTEPFFDDCGCGCADVGGGCTTTALCVEGYVWDARACECVPDGGQACGNGFCPAGQVCCNSSCGICTPPDGVCTQQFCGEVL